LSSLFEFFAKFLIAPFDQAAADLFDSLQSARVRIATRDLKIAAISLASNALLLTPIGSISRKCRGCGLRIGSNSDRWEFTK